MTNQYTPSYNTDNIKPPIISSLIIVVSMILIVASIIMNFFIDDGGVIVEVMFYSGLLTCLCSILYFGIRYGSRQTKIKQDEEEFRTWTKEQGLNLSTEESNDLYYYSLINVPTSTGVIKYVLQYDLDSQTYTLESEKEAFESVETKNIQLP